jgi:RsiW-degrading membrane proteinase PrsW (M82 family)
MVDYNAHLEAIRRARARLNAAAEKRAATDNAHVVRAALAPKQVFRNSKTRVTTTEIVAQAIFTMIVVLRLWKGWDVTLHIVTPALAALMYVTPSFLVARRPHPRRKAVVAMNLLLGWTIVGWLASLAMAMRGPEERAPLADTR